MARSIRRKIGGDIMSAALCRILTFALLSLAVALLVGRGFWWSRAAMNGFDAANSALGVEPAFAANAVSPPQATSVTILTAPKWLESPTLDGQCDDTEYTESGPVSLLTPAGGPGAEVKLLHSGLGTSTSALLPCPARPASAPSCVLMTITAAAGWSHPAITSSASPPRGASVLHRG
jgi:hypothetical protein